MTEYISSVIAATAIVSLGGFLSYGKGSAAGAARMAMSLILLYTVCTPVISFVADFDESAFEGIFSDTGEDAELDESLYYETARGAFCEGIQKMLCERFSLSRDDVEVEVFGFDVQSMSANKVKVILKGRALTADARGIEDSVRDAGLGECEVELEITG